MPTGCERPISATAMPTKPASGDEVERDVVLVAHDRVQRHQPASAPEISMMMMMIRVS